MPARQQAAHGEFAPGCAVLQVRVNELKQLYNAMDPAPFRERDLDPKAEEYIVEWSREVAPDQPLGLVVYVAQAVVTPEEIGILRDAMHEYFRQRAATTRQQLRQLLRVGRKSLLIGLFVLAVAIALGDLVSGWVGRYDYGEIVAHSLLIGGWVALWRPLEILLYDWWPIRAEAQLYDRLSMIEVRVDQAADGAATPGAAA